MAPTRKEQLETAICHHRQAERQWQQPGLTCQLQASLRISWSLDGLNEFKYDNYYEIETHAK